MACARGRCRCLNLDFHFDQIRTCSWRGVCYFHPPCRGIESAHGARKCDRRTWVSLHRRFIECGAQTIMLLLYRFFEFVASEQRAKNVHWYNYGMALLWTECSYYVLFCSRILEKLPSLVPQKFQRLFISPTIN